MVLMGHKLRSLRYAEYDFDGAQPLDWEEFYAAQPHRIREMHSTEVIRTWFDSATENAAAGLSINAFFLWTLSAKAAGFGASSLEACFGAFDSKPSYQGRTGLPDEEEFLAVSTAVGFENRGRDIFRSLDKDHSGEVSYEELTESIEREGCSDISYDAKRMLLALAWSASTLMGSTDEVPPPSASADGLCLLRQQAVRWRLTGLDHDANKQAEAAEADAAQKAQKLVEARLSGPKSAVGAARRAEAEAAKRAKVTSRAVSDANMAKVRLDRYLDRRAVAKLLASPDLAPRRHRTNGGRVISM